MPVFAAAVAVVAAAAVAGVRLSLRFLGADSCKLRYLLFCVQMRSREER